GTAYILLGRLNPSDPLEAKTATRVRLVDFLQPLWPDACRPIGGPAASYGTMRWPSPRVDRVSPPSYVGTERRRTPRYYVPLPVESVSGTGMTLDVNEDGVRFETNHRFVYGDVVTLRLVFRHIAGDYTHIDVSGDVVRVEEVGEAFVVAVRVDEIHVG